MNLKKLSALFLILLLLPAIALATACSSAGPEAETAAEAASVRAPEAGHSESSEQGESHGDATESAPLRANSLAAIYRQHATGSNRTPTAHRIDGQRSMKAAVVLARFSSTDSYESEQREQAAEELKTRFESRDLDANRALGLLDTIVPEASINARREAARELARLSQAEDWDGRNTLDAAEELTRLITGDRLDAEKRIGAAKELARRSETGNLDVDGALNLMNDIAPEASINARREAASDLVRLSQSESWDADTSKQAAEQSFKLITGGDLNVDKRTDAAVDLTGEGIKKFGGDSFDDRDVDVSTEMIKSALKGDLTTDKVSDLLNLK